MHSRHAEAIFEIYIMAVDLKFQKHVCVHKINSGCIIGLKKNALSKEPVDLSPLLNWKFFKK